MSQRTEAEAAPAAAPPSAPPPVVDVHTHLFPPSALAAADSSGEWFGSAIERNDSGGCFVTTLGKQRSLGSAKHFEAPERRIERMDALRVDAQALSILPPLTRYGLGADHAVPAAQSVNEEIAAIVAAHPTRFLGLATLPLQDPDAAVKELDRAINQLGMIGVQIGTHVAGTNLDAPELFPVLEACADLKAFVFVHPQDPRGGTSMKSYYLGNLVGNPWETTVAIGALVFGGVLERLPQLTIAFAHAGGYSSFAIGRFAHGYRVREDTKAASQTPPRETFARLLFDSLTHDDLALRYLLDVVGPEHVVLGSDYPAGMGPVQPAGDILDSTRLSATERQAILGGTFARVMDGLGRSEAVARLQNDWAVAALNAG